MLHLILCSSLVFNTFLGKHRKKNYVVHGLSVLADFELTTSEEKWHITLPKLWIDRNPNPWSELCDRHSWNADTGWSMRGFSTSPNWAFSWVGEAVICWFHVQAGAVSLTRNMNSQGERAWHVNAGGQGKIGYPVEHALVDLVRILSEFSLCILTAL